MKRYSFHIAFALGALAVLWVAVSVATSHFLVLVMTAFIGAVYVFGAMELRQYRADTQSLRQALADLPSELPELGVWLRSLPLTLQNPIRQRVEGERVGLPGPSLTPYLVGLLVMLGMLGTFLGMVVTLNGAVFALEGSNNLAGIRAAFSEPIKGLGLAFGTSVAGVATSAMLGLMASLARRERASASQHLDTLSHTHKGLRSFSLTHQRQETFKALQQQAQALPQAVATISEHLQTMLTQMVSTSETMNARLLANQQNFHQEVQAAYTGLAAAVDQSLRSSLNQSVQSATDCIRPMVQVTMTQLADQAQGMSERVGLTLDGFSQNFEHSTQAVLDKISTAQAQQLAQHSQADQARLLAWQAALAQMGDALNNQWQASGAHSLAQQQSICDTLSRTAQDITAQSQSQSAHTLAEIHRLIEVASEAPKAAAEVIGQLRQDISVSASRDNALLEERTRILSTLSTLLDAIHHASTEQRGVIDALVASSRETLLQATGQFHGHVLAETDKLGGIAAQVTASAVDVASLGETFGFAVRTFSESNDKLMANLQRIEAAMDKSMTRSDEQLAYYVAQAREMIDLSIHSQKDVLEALQQRQAEGAT